MAHQPRDTSYDALKEELQRIGAVPPDTGFSTAEAEATSPPQEGSSWMKDFLGQVAGTPPAQAMLKTGKRVVQTEINMAKSLINEITKRANAGEVSLWRELFGTTPPGVPTQASRERRAMVPFRQPLRIPAAIPAGVIGVLKAEPFTFEKQEDPFEKNSYEMLKNLGYSDTEAMILSLGSGFTAGTKVINLAAKPIATAARIAGRTTEPLRQIPAISQVMHQIGKVGGGKAAYSDRTLRNYANYVIGKAPGAKFTDWAMRKPGTKFPNERELTRTWISQGAGRGEWLSQMGKQAHDAWISDVKAYASETGLSLEEAERKLLDIYESTGRGAPYLREYLSKELKMGKRLGLKAEEIEMGRAPERIRRSILGTYSLLEKERKTLAKYEEIANQPGAPAEQVLKANHASITTEEQIRLLEEKLDRQMHVWEQKMGYLPDEETKIPTYALPRDIERSKAAGREFIGPSEEAIKTVKEVRPPPYAPRSTGEISEKIHGKAPFRKPFGISTSLGRGRQMPPWMTTKQAEEAIQTNLYPKWFQNSAKDVHRAGGTSVLDKRYYAPLGEALESHVNAMSRAHADAFIIRAIAHKWGIPNEQAPAGFRRLSDMGILSGFDEATERTLSGFSVSPDVERTIKALAAISDTEPRTGIGRAVESALRLWRPIVTVVRPEFHIRNFLWSKYIQAELGNVNPMNDAMGISTVLGRKFGPAPDVAPPFLLNGKTYNGLTWPEVKRLFVQHRILSAGRMEEIGKTFLKGPGKAYQGLEDYLRASWAWYNLGKGSELSEAARSVGTVMFNYGWESMTHLESLLRRGIVPFMGWGKNIPRLAGRVMGEHPSTMANLGRLQETGERRLGMTEEDREIMDPSYRTRGGIPVSYDPETGKLRYLGYQWVGITDPGQYSPTGERSTKTLGKAVGPLEGMVSNVNPLGQGIYELTTGRNPMTGIYGKGTVELPSYAKLLVGKVPGIELMEGRPIGPKALDLALRLAGPLPNVPFDLRDKEWARWARGFRTLTGVPIYESDTERGIISQTFRERGKALGPYIDEADRERLRGRLSRETVVPPESGDGMEALREELINIRVRETSP